MGRRWIIETAVSIFLFFSLSQITDLHARHKRTLFCWELPLVPLSCPHSPLVSRSHMWHGGRGRLLRALLRRGIVWTSSSELSEVPSELSVSASVFAAGSSGTRGIGRIHSSSLDDSPLLLLANGFVFKAGRMSLTWHGVPSTSTACSLMMPVIFPLRKRVVHRLLGGFTQTVSPNSYSPLVPYRSGRRASMPLMRTRYRWIALAGALAAVTVSFGVALYL